MSNYDNWLLRGSGVFTTETEVTLDERHECGSTIGIAVVDDFGQSSLTCAECEAEIDVPDEVDEPDHDWHDARYGS